MRHCTIKVGNKKANKEKEQAPLGHFHNISLSRAECHTEPCCRTHRILCTILPLRQNILRSQPDPRPVGRRRETETKEKREEKKRKRQDRREGGKWKRNISITTSLRHWKRTQAHHKNIISKFPPLKIKKKNAGLSAGLDHLEKMSEGKSLMQPFPSFYSVR